MLASANDVKPTPGDSSDIWRLNACQSLRRLSLWHCRERDPILPFWPLLFGTLISSVIALALAIPISVGGAILLVEKVPQRLQGPLGTFLELLAGIPSVIYGLWAFFVLVPVFDRHVDPFLAHSLGRVPILGALFGNPGPAGAQIE